MFFDNHRDATMRLEGTIITYQGRASLVKQVNDNLSLVLERLHDGKGFFDISQRDEELLLRAPCLGYVNIPEKAVFAMRTPARMWKQGLHVRSIRYKNILRPFAVDNTSLAKCLDNDYPTFEKALESFKSTNPFKPDIPHSIAFSRRWAVTKDGNLLYKGDEVGKLKDKPMLSDKYIWLAEDLQETLDANR